MKFAQKQTKRISIANNTVYAFDKCSEKLFTISALLLKVLIFHESEVWQKFAIVVSRN